MVKIEWHGLAPGRLFLQGMFERFTDRRDGLLHGEQLWEEPETTGPRAGPVGRGERRLPAIELRPSAVEQRVGIGPDSSGLDRQIAQVRRDKESAIDAQAFGHPGRRTAGRRTAGRRTVVARRHGRGLGTRLHLVPFHRWDILRHITT